MEPKVTIVIPVYNGAAYMRDAIDSALNQSYRNCEVIVVNDGSVDESEKIAQSYGDKIRYFAKENGGVSTALNMGIANMRGEYFQFLPCDDVLHPDKIKLQIEAIQSSGNNMSVVWTGWNELKEPEHKIIPYVIPPWYPKSCWTNQTYPLLFSIINAGTVLINRNYFEALGLFDETLFTSQDYDLLYRVFTNQNTIYLEQPLMSYRVHSGQGNQNDKTFQKNCEDLSRKMVNGLTEKMIEGMFGSHYKFFFEMLKYYQDAGWTELAQETKRKFAATDEPENGAKIREELANLLYKDGRKVILYGAGKNGKRLQRELWMHGVDIFAFCDGDPGKIGTRIGGAPCISKEELTLWKEKWRAKVIITIDQPEPVRKELLSLGLEQVTDYAAVMEQLWTACPIKERVL